MPTVRLSACSILFVVSIVKTTGSAQSAQDNRIVENGIDVLQKTGFAQLAGSKVGLISNHTGLNLTGESTTVLLHRAENVELKRLFSPEHGFYGKAEGVVGHTVHAPTGMPIHSLYTKDRAPNAESLKDIDTLVFDIQDIGCRFYTYIATMGEAMQVAHRHKLRFVVLDRPNPIGGVDVGGPMRDDGEQRFVAWHNLPVRHGMTVGELARMFDQELELGCDLVVVQMKGWQRRSWFDATGQTWVDPSPNMRGPTQALLYPGVGLLETTNLSVGRGTDTPFEVLGAPWMDGPKLARAIHAARVPGLRCVPILFSPTTSKHAKKKCSGVRFVITNRSVFDPIRLGIELACALRRLHRKAWDMTRYNRLLANREVFDLIAKGKRPATILQAIQKQVGPFYQRRARFLLYK